MASRKKPEQRRANLPRRSDYTKTFVKAWDRLNKAGKLDMSRIKEVMALIVANDGPLGAEWKDHELQGQWKGFRECHVGGDFLLVYQITDHDAVIFTDAGSHSDLFG